MEKMNFESPDLTRSNIQKLAELFPSVVTEARDAGGKLKKVVDFEALRRILGGEVLEGDEAYAFTWVGKREAQAERAVFRDAAFASAQDRINAGELFKTFAPDTVVKVL